jgi:hypothetical protein
MINVVDQFLTKVSERANELTCYDFEQSACKSADVARPF